MQLDLFIASPHLRNKWNKIQKNKSFVSLAYLTQIQGSFSCALITEEKSCITRLLSF